MAKANGMLALLLGGGKTPPAGSAPAKVVRRGPSRDDLKAAVRDFSNASDDDAKLDALLSFQELARDYDPD